MTIGIRTKTRKWGNSLGVVLPAQTRKELQLKPGQEIEITIKATENPLKELFGIHPDKKPTEEILRELRRNESKWL